MITLIAFTKAFGPTEVDETTLNDPQTRHRQKERVQTGGTTRMKHHTLSRRKFIKRTALATTAAIAAPYVRGVYAAGSLTMGSWDHWVPGANDALTKIVNE